MIERQDMKKEVTIKQWQIQLNKHIDHKCLECPRRIESGCFTMREPPMKKMKVSILPRDMDAFSLCVSMRKTMGIHLQNGLHEITRVATRIYLGTYTVESWKSLPGYSFFS